jgi:hypothetical protein
MNRRRESHKKSAANFTSAEASAMRARFGGVFAKTLLVELGRSGLLPRATVGRLIAQLRLKRA